MSESAHRARVSAGILLFRRTPTGPEVLLGHPGGPYFRGQDRGVWSIPKGEVQSGEELLAVALREFAEETGHVVGTGNLMPLGSVLQRSGKQVHAWAVEGDMDPSDAVSNTFAMEWPPRTGLSIQVPEIDRVAWCPLPVARVLIHPAQVGFLDRLEQVLRTR